jgi:hypothetical protein
LRVSKRFCLLSVGRAQMAYFAVCLWEEPKWLTSLSVGRDRMAYFAVCGKRPNGLLRCLWEASSTYSANPQRSSFSAVNGPVETHAFSTWN